MMKFVAMRSGVLALACAAALAACAKEPDENAATTDGAAAGPVPPLTADTGAMQQTAPAAGGVTDANVAAIASAANQDEIQTSQLALEKGQNASVKEFAQRMVTEHGQVEQQMQQALTAKSLAPQDNAQSTQMKQQLATTLQQLQAASGADFDRAYIAHQVQAHQATLDALNTVLIPSTQDPEIKGMLQNQVLPAVQMHLQQAQQIQSSLGA